MTERYSICTTIAGANGPALCAAASKLLKVKGLPVIRPRS